MFWSGHRAQVEAVVAAEQQTGMKIALVIGDCRAVGIERINGTLDTGYCYVIGQPDLVDHDDVGFFKLGNHRLFDQRVIKL